jgi:GrpB-like predicted nucleotidyltransferase (UPF0157 family)
VRIYRYGGGVTIPVTQYGSSFRIGPLTGPGSQMQAQVMFLEPGGVIGRHPAAGRQLFAVMSGSGEVTGADGASREIGPGYAALWEPWEEHGVTTAAGLTAVCVEGEFEPWAMGVTRDIEVSDYDPAWADWFARLHGHIWPAVADVAVRIDHVGSTSVPGLAAKPIIDMDIVVTSQDGIRPVIDRLAGLGYRWRGDLEVTGREAFSPPAGADLPPHHLFLVVADSKAHLDHWLLRDLLRQDPAARERYAGLKRDNVALADGDMEFYVAAKAALVAELLTRARAERGFPPAEYWQPEMPDRATRAGGEKRKGKDGRCPSFPF